MSDADDYRKYARRRRFEYPGEARNGEGQEDDCYETRRPAPGPWNGNWNTDEGGFERDSYTGQEDGGAFNARDPYAEEAELAIQNGDIPTAMEALGSSISEYNNINSVKRMGELLLAGFFEAYGEKGLDRRDRQGMELAETVIGLLSFYWTVKGVGIGMPAEEEQELLKNLENMSLLFHDFRDFRGIYDSVKEKIESSDMETFINQFLRGGFS